MEELPETMQLDETPIWEISQDPGETEVDESTQSKNSESGLDISDEYENLDENASDLKKMVKRATWVCVHMTKENAEYFELYHHVQEQQEIIDDMTLKYQRV